MSTVFQKRAEWYFKQVKGVIKEELITIVEEHGYLVGYEKNEKEFYLWDMYVEPEFRKSGIAKNLVYSFIRKTKPKYVSGTPSKASIPFWKKIGFEWDGHHIFKYFEDGGE